MCVTSGGKAQGDREALEQVTEESRLSLEGAPPRCWGNAQRYEWKGVAAEYICQRA